MLPHTPPRPLRTSRPLLGRIRAAAIVLALLCAPGRAVEPPVPEDEPITQADIDRAIDRGVEFLLSRQQLDGSWRPDEHKYIAGQTGLCIYTLLKAGVSPRHPSVLRGIAFIRSHPPRWTYGIACCLMALQTADARQYADEIETWAAILLECQGIGFSYPGNHEDLSLTQYGCLGLRAAEAAGLEIPEKIWEGCIDFALRVHRADGSFTYREGTQSTGSMTAAGIAVLEICRQALTEKGALRRKDDRETQEAIDAGVAWLAEHMRMDRNPDPGSENQNAGHMTRWLLYYLYGLERVGGLTGLDQFGDRDWYAEASDFLVKKQGDRGQWGTANGEPHPGTCFGVLVLKRATAPSTGAKPRSTKSYGGDDPELAVSIRVTGDTPLSAWVSSWGRTTREKYEWDAERKKGPRVWRVEYVNAATNEILATVDGDPEEPAKSERFAAQFSMPEPGAYSVFARVLVRPIDDDEGEEVELISPTIEVSVDGVMTEAMREAIRDFERDELDKTQCTVKASSVVNGGHTARFVRDGNLSYGWLSKPDDETPTIHVEPDRPQRADHVVLSPYYESPDKRGVWGRAKRVLLEVNRTKVGEFDLDPSYFGKAYLPLPKTKVVREIEVTVLEIEKGSHGAYGMSVGFAEIELQRRPDLVKKRKAEEKARKKAGR